ncbi:MAG: cation:proton antiporter [Thermoplasmata archaeon]
MLTPDLVFLLLAAIILVGFVLNALFDRVRVTNIVPLMLIGVLLVQSGIVSTGTLGFLGSFTPYVSSLTIAFILFAVGLEIQATDLYRVFGRATAYTLSVQLTTGVALSAVAWLVFRWPIDLAFVFGFALSGPSAVAVPALARVTRINDALRTTMVYESVFSDVLQLVVPLLLLSLYRGGALSLPALSEMVAIQILGSAGAGVLAAVVWLWVLDSLREVTRGYTWTLTITLVIATYALADRAGLNAAITIFVFGLLLGNALVLDRPTHVGAVPAEGRLGDFIQWLRDHLHLRTYTLDIHHIEQVHREVSFFASCFFFVYLGLLFEAPGLTAVLLATMVGLSLVMLAARVLWLPILRPYLSPEPSRASVERGLLGFNLSRGLSPAVVATIPATLGIVIPGFVDAMFLGILLSNLVGTVGVFLFYRPKPGGEAGAPVDTYTVLATGAGLSWAPGPPGPSPTPYPVDPGAPAAPSSRSPATGPGGRLAPPPPSGPTPRPVRGPSPSRTGARSPPA